MKIECKILPIATVEVLIKKEGEEVFYCDIPIPNELIDDPDFDYESHAIEIAKENYEIYTEPEEEPSEDEAYKFTSDQLFKILIDAIGMGFEYEEKHGYEKERAINAGALETLEGIDAYIDYLEIFNSLVSEDELPEQLKVHAEIDEFLEAGRGDLRVEIARQKVYQYITQEFLAQDDKWGEGSEGRLLITIFTS